MRHSVLIEKKLFKLILKFDSSLSIKMSSISLQQVKNTVLHIIWKVWMHGLNGSRHTTLPAVNVHGHMIMHCKSHLIAKSYVMFPENIASNSLIYFSND